MLVKLILILKNVCIFLYIGIYWTLWYQNYINKYFIFEIKCKNIDYIGNFVKIKLLEVMSIYCVYRIRQSGRFL